MMNSMNYNPTVVFKKQRHVVVENQPVPVPKSGEVLIRTHCSLISIGTELSILDVDEGNGETWREMQQFPFLPGYDNVGTVISVGDGVETSWIGKRVVSWGTHGAYVTVDVNDCWPILREVSDHEAAFLVLFHVAANGLRRSGLVLGESAVVFGLGIIGQLTAQLCHLAGTRPVIGVDSIPQRVELLLNENSIAGIVAGEYPLMTAVSERTRGRMADVVFELTGNASLIPQECEILRDQGRLVIVSSPRSKTHFDFHDHCNRRSISIIGAHNWSHPTCATPDQPWTMARHAELFFDLIANQDLDVKSMITHQIPVEEAPSLYEQLLQDRGEALGVILEFPHPASPDGENLVELTSNSV